MSRVKAKIHWLKTQWQSRPKEQRRTAMDVLHFKYFVKRSNPDMLDFYDLIDDTDLYLMQILQLEPVSSVSANELPLTQTERVRYG
jgi:hypothetical protein